jgi:hypothetical protein
MWVNTSNGMRVRTVWFQGKRWQITTPAQGPNAGRMTSAVWQDSRQQWPRTWGTHLGVILRAANRGESK